MRGLWDNPLVRLESRRRFRRLRAAVGLPLALLLPALVVTLVYVSQVRSNETQFPWAPVPVDFPGDVAPVEVLSVPDGFGGRFDSTFFFDQDVGRGVFIGCFVTLALVALLLVPSMVGPSIATERAELTLQAMQLTRLTATDLVAGKLAAPLMYLGWLGAGSLPLVAIAYALGGVSVASIVVAYLVLGLFVLELAVVSLAFSASVRRPGLATTGALVGSVGLCIVPWILGAVGALMWSIVGATTGGNSNSPPDWLIYVGSPSPGALSSLMPFVDFDSRHLTGLRVASVAWSVVIIVVAWRTARRGVTAPVERDR